MNRVRAHSTATKFPTELKEIKYEIEAHARDFGLDFFPVIFEILDYAALNEVASYGGFPYRYPHWRFGMEYDRLSKSHAYGLSKIYEMVINNNPCYAYLLKCNNVVDQKLVMGHVYAHCDFFKNNVYFAHTNRKMVDEMANHATRVQRYVDRYGADRVEAFIDCCLSLENLIDPHWPFIRRRDKEAPETVGWLNRLYASMAESKECRCEGGDDVACTCANRCGPPAASNGKGDQDSAADLFPDEDDEPVMPKRLQSKGYMDAYINPPDFLAARSREIRAKRRQQKRFPANPESDILLFLVENGPLKNWQRDVLSILREEAYYFLPQAQTKIMNEGWATYWHSRMMTEKVLGDAEIIDYADHHSGTVGGSRMRLNPYKLGLELFRDIEDRWNKGRFGKEYQECDDLRAREGWNLDLGRGQEKIFEVRRNYNDLTFIDTFLTEDFCRRHKLFLYAKQGGTPHWVISSRDFERIKQIILGNLTNVGAPVIRILDGNYGNRGELLLTHQHEGVDLKWDFARETLVNVHRLWKRPVHVETVKEEKKTRLSFDGKEAQAVNID